MSIETLQSDAVALLERLAATPSISRSEGATADLLCDYLHSVGIAAERLHNNVYARCEQFDLQKPTLLLNSHHDTVKPTSAWTRDPFTPVWEGERLYGLGVNDAGGSVVSLIALFRHYYHTSLPFNLLLALSAEEECMGEQGTRALLPTLGHIDMALVGEPTRMQAAVGERGLMVLDCTAHGRAGHAARNEGINALYIAVDDIDRLRNYHFDRESALLGPIRTTVTQIEAGTQHNVVPAECHFVVDVRTTDAYTNEQTATIIADLLTSDVVPRSTRIHASAIDASHPLVTALRPLAIDTFISPTTSDMALMAFPSLKMGVGDSARSHTADEYVLRSEVEQGVATYIRYIASLAQLY
jgi:acetylornithine deacetylase